MENQNILLFLGIITFIILSGILTLFILKKETNYDSNEHSASNEFPIITKENCINRSSCINTGSFLDGAGDGPKNCRCGYPRKPTWK